jgi:hypothetical protein
VDNLWRTRPNGAPRFEQFKSCSGFYFISCVHLAKEFAAYEFLYAAQHFVSKIQASLKEIHQEQLQLQ